MLDAMPMEESRRVRGAAWAVVLVILPGACRGGPPPSPGPTPRPVREVERWEVRRDRRAVGRLVLLEIPDPHGALRFYRVESPDGQWLGFVDLRGRVYQRVPFSTTEVYRGMYTMREALNLLLGERDGSYAFALRSRRGVPVEAVEERLDPETLIREASRTRRRP